MDEVKTVNHIKEYIKSKGYICQDGSIENVYLSLKSKPFLIFDGPYTNEQLRFVQMFFESIDITSQNGRFKIAVPCGICDKNYNPLGHIGKDGAFCLGEVLNFITKALHNPDYPHVLYIDNLNMVNPEEYLRNILFAMDTLRQDENGTVISEPILNPDVFCNDTEKQLYKNLMFPPNLYIICSTVTDESRYMVPDQIKSRANIIEFGGDYIKLSREKQTPINALTGVKNEFLKSEFASGACYDEECETSLNEINNILKSCQKDFGYTIHKEIMAYYTINKKLELLTKDEAFDNCLLQRILTRINEYKDGCKNILPLIFRLCVPKGVGDYYASSFKMNRALSYPDCRYKKSAEKIILMTRRIEENGYCTF